MMNLNEREKHFLLKALHNQIIKNSSVISRYIFLSNQINYLCRKSSHTYETKSFIFYSPVFFDWIIVLYLWPGQGLSVAKLGIRWFCKARRCQSGDFTKPGIDL